MTFMIHAIPAFKDNYIWLMHSKDTNSTYIVDPGDAEPVIEMLDLLKFSLDGILITHHHPDHTGGIDELLKHYSIPVFGTQRIEQATNIVRDKDIISLSGHEFEVISIPGHTRDHLAYYSAKDSILFSGDTLFSGGCGRLFEGTPQQMHASLSKLSTLPPSTKIYCGHEYTENNIGFALNVDAKNESLKKYAEKVQILRMQNKPSLPSTIGLELEINPFLRADNKDIQEAVKSFTKKSHLNVSQTFAAIRKWKDTY